MSRKLFASLVLLIAAGAMIYSGSQLIATEQIYRESDAVYHDISKRVRGETAADSAAPRTGKADFSELGINFDALHEINNDAAAWLYCPDTAIDYPVMKADDYSYYLYHLPDGAQNTTGALGKRR